MFQQNLQPSDMCWDCDLVGRESCKTCTKEKIRNRCSVYCPLCGTSVAPGRTMEHLRRHSELPRSPRHMIAVPQEDLCPLCSWIFTKLSTGETVTNTRGNVGQWWMDLLPGVLWASIHSSQAHICLGKHVWAPTNAVYGGTGHADTIRLTAMDWACVQRSTPRIWSHLVPLVRECNFHGELCPWLGRRWKILPYFSFTSANGWISVLMSAPPSEGRTHLIRSINIGWINK